MDQHPHRSYAFLVALFSLLFAGFEVFSRSREKRYEPMSTMDLMLLSLALFRFSRLASYDKVTSWLRLPFVQEGQGAMRPEEVQEAPRGRGLRLAIAELITCSWCTAPWLALVLVYGLRLFPGVTRPFMTIMAISGAAQLLDALFGLMHWTTARVRTQ